MRIFATLIGLAVAAFSAHAQLTFTYDDYANMAASNSSTTYTAETQGDVQFDIGGTGQGQVWDFTGFTYSPESSENTFVDPSTTPYTAQFPNATHATGGVGPDGEGYGYLLLDQTGFYFLGLVGTVQGQQFTLEYDPPKPEMKFPGRLGTSWDYDGNPVSIGGVSTQQTRSETQIDASGTLVLPQGSYECLRMRTIDWITSKVEYNGQVVSEQVTKNVSYTFMTKDGANATIVADTASPETGTITASNMSYVIFSGTTSIGDPQQLNGYSLGSAYPNPVSAGEVSSIRWSVPAHSNVSVAVYDVTGRRVADVYEGAMNAGTHTRQFSTEGLTPGTYFVRMNTGSEVFVKSIAVIR